MKITICGSMVFAEEMTKAKVALEAQGHEVQMPPLLIQDDDDNTISIAEYYRRRKAEINEHSWIWDRKQEAMKAHFNKVEWCDAVLILNHSKDGVDGYIGGNTLLEMGLALHLDKKIFLLNAIPEISYKEEILGMKPIVLDGDLSKLFKA